GAVRLRVPVGDRTVSRGNGAELRPTAAVELRVVAGDVDDATRGREVVDLPVGAGSPLRHLAGRRGDRGHSLADVAADDPELAAEVQRRAVAAERQRVDVGVILRLLRGDLRIPLERLARLEVDRGDPPVRLPGDLREVTGDIEDAAAARDRVDAAV